MMLKLRNLVLIHFLSAAILLVPLNSLGQITSHEIDLIVKDAMKKFTVAGVAVGVVKDGKIIHAKGYGVRSVETGEPVNEWTDFAIASNSKAFTTTALALLVEEGKLGWQDRVVDHIPEFRMYNEYVTQNFTIEDLITHRSGLGLGAGDLQIWPSGSDFTIADMLEHFRYFEPVSPFRTKYDYDNILYHVAGEVIRRVSGESWEEFVRERIMDPIGMKHTYTLPPGMVEDENLASPHLAEDGVLKVIPYYEFDPEKTNGAAAGVLSNAQDLCRWMLLHLNGGRYGDNLENQLFTEKSHWEMWRIHTPIEVKPNERYHTHFTGYGLGWRISDMDGQLVVSHTGDVSGMLSKTMLLPDLNLGVVVLTNSYYGGAPLFSAVSQTIVDRFLGMEDVDWTDRRLRQYNALNTGANEVVEKVWAEVKKADDSRITPGDFTGSYEDPWFGTVIISEQEGRLWFTSIRSPRLTGPMFYYNANAFAIKWEERDLDADAFALFILDEEGRARGFTMKGISPDIDFSYDFQDLEFTRTAE